MGLFICDICNEQLNGKHVCNLENVKKYVNELKESAMVSAKNLAEIQNAVFMILQELPPPSSAAGWAADEWIDRLWEAAKCQHNNIKTKEQFLVRWTTMHRILSEAFDVFRSVKYGKKESILDKLKSLKEACKTAQEVFGYQDSKLDLTPEDICDEILL